MLVGLLSMAPGACAACEGEAVRAEKPAEGKRCCFDDLVFEDGVTATGTFCSAGEWVRPGGACTIYKDGKMAASTKCGYPEKTNGKFEVECNSAKGKFSTSYSTCDAAALSGSTSAAPSSGLAFSGALQLAAFSVPTFALVALVAIEV